MNSLKPSALIRTLTVHGAPRLPGRSMAHGILRAGEMRVPCVLGTAGTTHTKREGDKATPIGRMRLLNGFYRPDRMSRPFCRVPLSAVGRHLGWCDDPASPLYNRLGRLPMNAGHERMWRSDGLYDLVFVLDYNIHPRRAGRGSAIFFHCAKPGFPPTLGCVALRPDDMRRLLPRLAPDVCLVVR